MGLIHYSGDTILPFRYRDIQSFGENKHLVSEPGVMDAYQLIDSNGRQLGVLPPGLTVKEVYRVRGNIFLVAKKNGRAGVLDADLNEVAPFAFDEIMDLNNTGILIRYKEKSGILAWPEH